MIPAYQAHDTIPAYEQVVWVDGKVVNRDALKWGGKAAPPAIGEKIVVTMNNIGPAIVTGYFTVGGWLGLCCKLLAPPAWHIKQNKGATTGHIFGPEFKMEGAAKAEAA